MHNIVSAKPFTRFDLITLSIRPAPRSRLIISISYASASTSTAEFRLKNEVYQIVAFFIKRLSENQSIKKNNNIGLLRITPSTASLTYTIY